MNLARPKYKDGIKSVVQSAFGGIDIREGARDGAISDMLNMTSDHYPVLSTRGARAYYEDYDKITAKYNPDAEDGTEVTLLCVCDVSDVPYYLYRIYDYETHKLSLSVAMIDGDGILKDITIFEDSAPTYDQAQAICGEVRAVAFNKKMVMFSEHLSACIYYDEECADLVYERIDYSWDGFDLVDAMSWHRDGKTYLQIMLRNFDAEELLRVGDVLCVRDPTYVEGDYEREFYLTVTGTERVTDIDGEECIILECGYNPDIMETRTPDYENYDPSTSYTLFAIRHSVPALEHVCVCRDRIWGTVGNEIYSCASGDLRNWYRYDNTAADSFYAQIGAVPRFTGIASYAGSVYFFTREDVYRMYGTTPDAFSLVALGTYGMDESEAESFGIAAGGLFYNSLWGPVCFDGNSAKLIAASLGVNVPNNVIGAGSGSKYYMAKGNKLYVYDAKCGTWQIHSAPMNIFDVGVFGGRAVAFEGLQAEYLDRAEGEEASPFDSSSNMLSRVEFADISEGGIYGVCPTEFTILASLGRDSELSLSISCDGGEWVPLWSTTEYGRHIHRVRFSPKTRCDYYRLRFDGEGEWKLYSLVRSYSVNASTHYGE